MVEDLLLYDDAVTSKIGAQDIEDDLPDDQSPNSFWDLSEDDSFAQVPYKPEAVMPEADSCTADAFDDCISAEVMIKKSDGFFSATVIDWKCYANGDPIGTRNTNPILDTRVYNVRFGDGHTEAFSANVIAQALWDQVDDNGDQFLILQEITSHQKDDAVAMTSSVAWEVLIMAIAIANEKQQAGC